MSNQPLKLKKKDLEVVTSMNAVYFEGGGSGCEWNPAQIRFATDYFLQLLEGSYIDLPSQTERRIKKDSPQKLVIHSALCAFTDFTEKGWDFLYHTDSNIPEHRIREISLKLIEKIEGTNFTDRDCTITAITVLTGMMNEKVLPSAKNTWLEDHYHPPRVPYDADVTNKFLIPESVQYARKNLPFNK